MSTLKGLDLMKVLVERSLKAKSFDAACVKGMKFLSAGDGHCKAEFTVSDEHLNAAGTLHGGCSTTIIDCISTYALMTKGISPGVSVDLNVSFLKAAKAGEVITVDAKTIKSGRTLAFLEVEMLKKEGGAIIARGQHTKFIGS
ncbi:acyl-coenzyme A thioesterase 13-like [Diachasma alloeum]|uniref:acyl-coenzyme A thioesterase 13-like n=1 Tax=Diachasma alloeum TaxID=454923 RepID=UPI000738263F|nr:acyl-coenzyme A thioesterase 13-like [Diachasma alloeum]XP_015127222.1 acyl-coenzyme A thioesterase 13-like [Diachasma alloeum]